MSFLDSFFKPNIVLFRATGKNGIEATMRRYVAMTRGGAEAKRVNTAAKEIARTPVKSIM